MGTERGLDNDSRLAVEGFISQFESIKTRESYEGAMRRFIDFAIASGIEDLTSVRSPLLDLYLEDMRKRGLANRTIRLRQQVLIQFFAYLVDRRLIESSPVMTGWKVTIEEALEDEPTLSMEQVDALLRVCASETEEVAVRLMGLAGLKPGHAFQLDVGDVQLNDSGTASIPESGELGTRISLDSETSSAVLDVIQGRTSGPLLLNHWGNRMTGSNFGSVLDRLGRRAGIGHRVTASTLWKSYLANQLDSGLSVRLLGQLTRRRAHRLVSRRAQVRRRL